MVLLKPRAGDQVYDVAPEAIKDVLVPPQIVVFPVIAITGMAITETVTVCVLVHTPFEPVTVYVVVEDGLATGFEIFGLLKPVVGDQLYEDAPLAVNVTEPPAQILPPPVTDTVGAALTPKVNEEVAEQPFVVPVTV